MLVNDKKVTYSALVEQNRVNTEQLGDDLSRRMRIVAIGARAKDRGYRATIVVVEGSNFSGKRYSTPMSMEDLLGWVMSGQRFLTNVSILSDWAGWGLI